MFEFGIWGWNGTSNDGSYRFSTESDVRVKSYGTCTIGRRAPTAVFLLFSSPPRSFSASSSYFDNFLASFYSHNAGLQFLIEYGGHSQRTLLLWRRYTSASIRSAPGWPRPQHATHPRYGSGIWQGFLKLGIIQLVLPCIIPEQIGRQFGLAKLNLTGGPLASICICWGYRRKEIHRSINTPSKFVEMVLNHSQDTCLHSTTQSIVQGQYGLQELAMNPTVARYPVIDNKGS
ncbi:hypothetical protein DFH07DRAFT_769701 [Mycena maculata]|uniref:Uncharacterized protein n=1 Tax=Mycena maculata TaxID=230809 RepID=A0AAD7JKW1_9AGAR|nr:hypothetical protein DFH07DRAFT_769701 [Mycena maculata]